MIETPVFFSGIGGSGMLPLASIVRAGGARVAGSDRSLDAGRTPSKFDYLRSLGVELVPTSAPDFFTTDTPTAVLVRQVLGAVSQFEKANLVAKLRAAREREIAAGGRGSGRFAYAQKVPEVVALVRELHGQRQLA